MVMFRDFARRNASKLGLVGTVKNNKDGSVTVVAQGDEEKLKVFLEKLNKGSMLSRVDAVKVVWGETLGKFKSFDILY